MNTESKYLIKDKEYQVDWVGINEISEASYNPRFISAEAFDGLKNSIQTFGLLDPIIANKETNNIIGGHQRWKAAKELGYEKVPVIWVELDAFAERLLNLSLNNPKVQGQFLPDELSEMLGFLKGHEFYTELHLEELRADFEEDIYSDEINNPKVPSDFKEVDESKMQFSHICPKCNFEFNE
jgi:hypothetical protein